MVVLTRRGHAIHGRHIQAALQNAMPLLVRFLSVKDVGELALLSSSVNFALADEEVWAVLLARDFPSTLFILKQFKDIFGRKRLYKMFSEPTNTQAYFPTPSKVPRSLHPPSYLPDEIAFLYEIQFKGRNLCWGYLRKAEASKLLETGRTTVTLCNKHTSFPILGEGEFCGSDEEQGSFDNGGREDLAVTLKGGFDPSMLQCRITMVRGSGLGGRRIFDSAHCQASIESRLTDDDEHNHLVLLEPKHSWWIRQSR